MKLEILDRSKTLIYLKKKLDSKERIVVPRYGDGEYLLATQQRIVAKEKPSIVGPMLIKALKVKGQFICTANASDNSIWGRTAEYITRMSGNNLYGVGAWIRHDIFNNNDLLDSFFLCYF